MSGLDCRLEIHTPKKDVGMSELDARRDAALQPVVNSLWAAVAQHAGQLGCATQALDEDAVSFDLISGGHGAAGHYTWCVL